MVQYAPVGVVPSKGKSLGVQVKSVAGNRKTRLVGKYYLMMLTDGHLDTLQIEYQDSINSHSGDVVGPSLGYAREIWEGTKTPVQPLCGPHMKKSCSTRTSVTFMELDMYPLEQEGRGGR